MINIKNLSKCYKGEKKDILKDVNISFSDKGFYCILGPSGCGKSTLLNCISTLLEFNGEININGTNIGALDNKSKEEFRLNNIGFIFQDFKLFNNDTVLNNIRFPLEIKTNENKNIQIHKCKDLAKLVGIHSKLNIQVRKLSGGEKQRVAIARALSNEPKILLCDEPTGSLDSSNSLQIMDILRQISFKKLVIVVTHNKDLARQYGDYIYEFLKGSILQKENESSKKESSELKVYKSKISSKKPHVPLSFFVRHSLQQLRERKWRSALTNFATSAGLIGVGLALSISSCISLNIKNAYKSLIDTNKIMISVNEKENKVSEKISSDFDSCKLIKNSYSNYVDDIGCIYKYDFNSFFRDEDCFYTNVGGYPSPISGLSSILINEFKWLDYENDSFYPIKPSRLNNDEIVLGLNLNMVHQICLSLKITRTAETLSEFINNNELSVVLNVRNNDWQYDDQQIFRVKAFSLVVDPCIYHFNHLWNEYVFEEQMRFPSNLNLDVFDYYPWVMKKINYLKVNDVESFLKYVYKDKNEDYIFELADYRYFPKTYEYETDSSLIDKVLIFSNTLPFVSSKIIDPILSRYKGLSSPMLGSIDGYVIYPEALMMGFSKNAFFSFDDELMFETLDIFSTTKILDNEKIETEEGILCGNYAKSLQNCINFSILHDNLNIDGSVPQSCEEIVISRGLYNRLLYKKDLQHETLYFSYTKVESTLGDGSVIREYKTVPLKISGIAEEEKLLIYHYSDWVRIFFEIYIGISAFNLVPQTIAFNLDESINSEDTIKKLEKDFPYYKITNPLNSINNSVDEVCGYLENGTYIISSVAILVAILLLTISNYLHSLEIRKDVALSRCIGVSSFESLKFVYVHSLILGIISFLLSSLELIIINFAISLVIKGIMGTELMFSLNPLAFIFMFLITIILSIVSSYFATENLNKLNPLEAFKK